MSTVNEAYVMFVHKHEQYFTTCYCTNKSVKLLSGPLGTNSVLRSQIVRFELCTKFVIATLDNSISSSIPVYWYIELKTFQLHFPVAYSCMCCNKKIIPYVAFVAQQKLYMYN
jgi:hypothetical protein